MQNSDQRKAYLQSYQANTHRVAITLTSTQYAELEKRAKREGVRVTTLCKNMTLAYNQSQQIPQEPILKELQELRFLLRNAANNINQIAHHSNTVGRLVDENGFLDEVRKMEQIVQDFASGKLKTKT